MDIHTAEFPLVACYLVPLRHKYPPRHPILGGPVSVVGTATGY